MIISPVLLPYDLVESFHGIFIDGDIQLKKHFHSLLGLHAVRNQTGVQQSLSQELIFQTGLIVDVKDLILHPFHRLNGSDRGILVDHHFAIDDTETG